MRLEYTRSIYNRLIRQVDYTSVVNPKKSKPKELGILIDLDVYIQITAFLEHAPSRTAA